MALIIPGISFKNQFSWAARISGQFGNKGFRKNTKKKINELNKSHASYALQTKQSLAFEKSAGSKNNNKHALLKSYLVL